jgi:hypothetical protein
MSKKLRKPKDILNDTSLNNWDGLKEIIDDDDIFDFYMDIIEENMIQYGKMVKKHLKKKKRI